MRKPGHRMPEMAGCLVDMRECRVPLIPHLSYFPTKTTDANRRPKYTFNIFWDPLVLQYCFPFWSGKYSAFFHTELSAAQVGDCGGREEGAEVWLQQLQAVRLRHPAGPEYEPTPHGDQCQVINLFVSSLPWYIKKKALKSFAKNVTWLNVNGFSGILTQCWTPRPISKLCIEQTKV